MRTVQLFCLQCEGLFTLDFLVKNSFYSTIDDLDERCRNSTFNGTWSTASNAKLVYSNILYRLRNSWISLAVSTSGMAEHLAIVEPVKPVARLRLTIMASTAGFG